MPNDINHKN